MSTLEIEQIKRGKLHEILSKSGSIPLNENLVGHRNKLQNGSPFKECVQINGYISTNLGPNSVFEENHMFINNIRPIPPIVQAGSTTVNKKKCGISVFLLASIYGDIINSEFIYNFGLDPNGYLCLNIYMHIDLAQEKNEPTFNSSSYFFWFDESFFDYLVPLDDIQTVQAFMVIGDPVTSRGTVTTVQPS